jgi:hypothetical protein
MDQEDTLVSELEQEQEAALETAILEEKTLLQELAREQNREIHVDTEPDTEQEDVSLAVCVVVVVKDSMLQMDYMEADMCVIFKN